MAPTNRKNRRIDKPCPTPEVHPFTTLARTPQYRALQDLLTSPPPWPSGPPCSRRFVDAERYRYALISRLAHDIEPY